MGRDKPNRRGATCFAFLFCQFPRRVFYAISGSFAAFLCGCSERGRQPSRNQRPPGVTDARTMRPDPKRRGWEGSSWVKWLCCRERHGSGYHGFSPFLVTRLRPRVSPWSPESYLTRRKSQQRTAEFMHQETQVTVLSLSRRAMSLDFGRPRQVDSADVTHVRVLPWARLVMTSGLCDALRTPHQENPTLSEQPPSGDSGDN